MNKNEQPSPQRVDDVKKAEEMAHAEVGHREYAKINKEIGLDDAHQYQVKESERAGEEAGRKYEQRQERLNSLKQEIKKVLPEFQKTAWKNLPPENMPLWVLSTHLGIPPLPSKNLYGSPNYTQEDLEILNEAKQILQTELSSYGDVGGDILLGVDMDVIREEKKREKEQGYSSVFVNTMGWNVYLWYKMPSSNE